MCDESSCKYGGVCKEEGDGLKCACQFQVRAAQLYVCHSEQSFRCIEVFIESLLLKFHSSTGNYTV